MFSIQAGHEVDMLSLLCIWCAASGSEFKGHSQAETTPVDTRSMLVQEGDPPMGRPVILSKEATLLAQPPSAAWGSAGSTGFDSSTQPSASAAPLPASSAPVDEPAQVGQVCCTVVRAGASACCRSAAWLFVITKCWLCSAPQAVPPLMI